MEKKKYSKFDLERALEHALVEAYMKTVKGGWKARLFSENWKQFIKDKFFEALKELKP